MGIGQRLFLLATRIGAHPADSTIDRLQKGLLVAVAVAVLPAGVVWGTVYWALGQPTAALLPWGYSAASAVAIALFAVSRSFTSFRLIELALILVTPFLLCIELGGITPSSGVILWSFLAPVGAIAFERPGRAAWWFAAFLALVAASLVIAPIVRPGAAPLPETAVIAFGAMNIGGVSAICFGLLAAFASQREQAQQRLEDLLLNILPGDIAERLQADPRAIADHYEHASVLFADVVEFTPMSERLRPSEVVALLDRLFGDFDELADAHGVEKIKTIGDCYMAAAGVPVPRPDHAQAVARLAVAMRDRAARELRADDGRTLQLRIGLNTGPVVAGVIGRRRFLYDLWGDAVNTASRMESHGTPGEIMLTKPMAELLADEFECAFHAIVDVKGKGPTEVWHLIGPRVEAHASATASEARQPSEAVGG